MVIGVGEPFARATSMVYIVPATPAIIIFCVATFLLYAIFIVVLDSAPAGFGGTSCSTFEVIDQFLHGL